MVRWHLDPENLYCKCQYVLFDLSHSQKKHKSKVAFLREELEKEEMYVEYLNKLLIDIERHRKQETHAAATCDDNNATSTSGPYDAEMTSQTVSAVATMNDENKRRSQAIAENADLCDQQQQQHLETKRASLHLDIEAVNKTANGNAYENCTLSNNSPFVTVISVSSPTAAAAALKNRSDELNKNQFQNLTFTKKKPLPGNINLKFQSLNKHLSRL